MRETVDSTKESCRRVGSIIRFLFWLFASVVGTRIIYSLYVLTIPEASYKAVLHASNTWRIYPFDGICFSSFIYDICILESNLHNLKLLHQINLWSDTLSMAAITYALWNMRSLFINIDKEYSPFIDKNSRAIRNVGFTILFLSIIPRIIKVTLISLFYTAGVTYFSNSVFLIMILIGCVVISLAKVFSYGCTLQEEYDETL